MLTSLLVVQLIFDNKHVTVAAVLLPFTLI